MKAKKSLITLGVLLSSLIAVCLLAVFFINGRLPAGTKIAGVDFSYKSKASAVEFLQSSSKQFLDQKIKIRMNDETQEVPVKDLGVNILTDDSIDIFMGNDLKNNLSVNIFKSTNARSISPIVTIDNEKLKDTVNEKFKLKNLAPNNPTISLSEDASLEVSAGNSGFVLDEESLIEDLKIRARNFSNQEVVLNLEQKDPTISIDEIEAQRPKLEEVLNNVLTLEDPIYSDDWDVKLKDYPDWVELSLDQEGKIVVGINRESLNLFIDEEISQWLDQPVDTVKITVDENGAPIIEGEGNDGLEVQRELFAEMIERTILTEEFHVKIPVKEISPQLDIAQELQNLGIKERIGIGHTSYYGSPANRVHNIKVAAAKFNGTLIAPGEEFSFNQNLGAVDASTGYRKELVIKKEGTIPEYGGGVCQVSTTMYRAALFSGLPITERHQHSYAVSYYSQIMGHGLDATIYLGGPDLKYTNDTGHDILVQSYVKDDYELYFVFYGTSDGRSVEMEGPVIYGYTYPGPTVYTTTNTLPTGQSKQTERSHTGFSVDWNRYISYPDGETIKEYIGTRYKAIPAKVLVGE